jgi:hypothetical protein
VGGEEAGEARGVAAGHAAFGADAVDAHVAAGGGETRLVALGIVVVDEAEVELGII